MQRTLRLTLLLSAILLTCVSGCGGENQQKIFTGSWPLVTIDDVQYQVDWNEYINRRGQRAFSCLLFYPLRTDVEPFYSMAHNSQQDSYLATIYSDGKNSDAKTETLYYTLDGSKVFEKTYQELGIDASLLTTNKDDMLIYLQPILKKLIREYVPQDSETEEQTE